MIAIAELTAVRPLHTRLRLLFPIQSPAQDEVLVRLADERHIEIRGGRSRRCAC
jgi:hypothetical protein